MSRGDEREGFSVELDRTANVVRVAAWGFWGPDIAAAFPDDVLSVCANARTRFGLFMDCSGLNPQRAEGQNAWGRLMVQVGSRATLAFVVVPNAVTRLQLIRIAKTTRATHWTFFSTLAIAAEALETNKTRGDLG
jgi:hypothetical protein